MKTRKYISAGLAFLMALNWLTGCAPAEATVEALPSATPTMEPEITIDNWKTSGKQRPAKSLVRSSEQ